MRTAALLLLTACGLVTAAGCALDSEGSLPESVSGASGAGTGGAGATSGAGSGGIGGIGGSAGGSVAGAGGIAGASGSGACNGLCTDVHASCAGGTCECESGYQDADADPNSAECLPMATINALELELTIDHSRLGNLTAKLQSPSGTVLTLMSRPGFTESADDGSGNGQIWPPFNYGPSGDQSDLVSSHPVRFSDGAPIDAEDMGFSQDGGGLAVCRDQNTEPGAAPGPECDYRPSPQSAGGPASFGAAFAGELATGTWSLCIGDSDPTATGALKGWALEITTVGGVVPAAAAGLDQAVPDDGYDGAPSSMLCHTLNVP